MIEQDVSGGWLVTDGWDRRHVTGGGGAPGSGSRLPRSAFALLGQDCVADVTSLLSLRH